MVCVKYEILSLLLRNRFAWQSLVWVNGACIDRDVLSAFLDGQRMILGHTLTLQPAVCFCNTAYQNYQASGTH